eukprot:1978541-Ditylum_brightwellii.AAC.1
MAAPAPQSSNSNVYEDHRKFSSVVAPFADQYQQHDTHNRNKEQEKGKIRGEGSKIDSNDLHYEQQSSADKRGKSKQVYCDFYHNFLSGSAQRCRSGHANDNAPIS